MPCLVISDSKELARLLLEIVACLQQLIIVKMTVISDHNCLNILIKIQVREVGHDVTAQGLIGILAYTCTLDPHGIQLDFQPCNIKIKQEQMKLFRHL